MDTASTVNPPEFISNIRIDDITSPITEAETDNLSVTNESVIDNLTVTDKSNTNNNPTESTTSVQHQVLLPPTLKSTPFDAPSKYTEQDNQVLEAVMPILFKLTPLLTVDIFERYQEAAQFKVAEAECAAMYENTKRSQMCNEVSKILDDEQSVKAPLLKSVISSEVQIELKNMRN